MKLLWMVPAFLLSSAAVAEPLATIRRSSGNCPVKCPTTVLSLDHDGLVTVEVQRFYPEKTYQKTVLLSLKPEVVRALQNDIQSIESLALFDLSEGEPVCTDAPDTYYSVYKAGVKIEIGKDMRCHKYRLVDYKGTFIADTLSSFLSLHYYSASN